MNAELLASLLAAIVISLIILLTCQIVTLTFPDQLNRYHCPRWLPVTWHIRWLELTVPIRNLANVIQYLCSLCI